MLSRFLKVSMEVKRNYIERLFVALAKFKIAGKKRGKNR